MSSPTQQDRLSTRSQWSNWMVLAVIVICLLAIYHLRPSEAPDGEGHPAVGKPLPTLQLKPLTGGQQPVVLGDLTGRVVLLNFWGTWCPPCLAELPHIAALEKQFRARPNFRLLAVSCGHGRQEDLHTLSENTKATLQSNDIDMPTFADPGAVTRGAVDQVAGFEGYPTTLILDRHGAIRGVWSGYRPGVEAEMRDLIGRLLVER